MYVLFFAERVQKTRSSCACYQQNKQQKGCEILEKDVYKRQGDALLNYAFETACRSFAMAEEEPGVLPRCAKAMTILAQKAGIYGMIDVYKRQVTAFFFFCGYPSQPVPAF